MPCNSFALHIELKLIRIGESKVPDGGRSGVTLFFNIFKLKTKGEG